ncbi:MAG TPA: glycosyltransferase family 61 protein [Rubrivivax sp.]|nr:glycosyltransferase family 61 protein [Rubrivivax sp.]
MITLAPLDAVLRGWLARRPRMAAALRGATPGWSSWTSATTLSEVARRSWVVAPAEAATIPAAIYDADDLLRVTGVDADSSRDIEWRRIRGGRIEWRASLAYELRDAVLSRGHVILPQMLRAVVPGPAPLWARYQETEDRVSLLTATFNGSRYFGHWVMDELTRLLAAPGIGQPVAPPRKMSMHQRQYLALLGAQPTDRTDVRFRQLVILDERNQNAYRRERFQVLRQRARSGRACADATGVMLLRRQTGVARILANEEELAERLAARGFRALCPTEHSVDEILDACMDAKVVVGVEGSQLIHALLVMHPGGTLVTLQPPGRFNNILKTYCDGLDLRYAFVVGHPCDGGFRVDPDQLARLLDRVRGS